MMMICYIFTGLLILSLVTAVIVAKCYSGKLCYYILGIGVTIAVLFVLISSIVFYHNLKHAPEITLTEFSVTYNQPNSTYIVLDNGNKIFYNTFEIGDIDIATYRAYNDMIKGDTLILTKETAEKLGTVIIRGD